MAQVSKRSYNVIHSIFRKIGIVYAIKEFKNYYEFKIRRWHPIYIIAVVSVSLVVAGIQAVKTFYETVCGNFRDN